MKRTGEIAQAHTLTCPTERGHRYAELEIRLVAGDGLTPHLIGLMNTLNEAVEAWQEKVTP